MLRSKKLVAGGVRLHPPILVPGLHQVRPMSPPGSLLPTELSHPRPNIFNKMLLLSSKAAESQMQGVFTAFGLVFFSRGCEALP